MSSFDMGNRSRGGEKTAAERARQQRLVVFIVATVLTLGGIGMAITALPVFVVLYGGMLPTLVAFLVDNRQGRYLFRTVGVTNAAGVIPFLGDSLHYTTNSGVIVSPAGDIQTWLTMYAIAAGGWLMHIGVPMLAQIVFEAILSVRMRRYQMAREALAREWDLDASEFDRD